MWYFFFIAITFTKVILDRKIFQSTNLESYTIDLKEQTKKNPNYSLKIILEQKSQNQAILSFCENLQKRDVIELFESESNIRNYMETKKYNCLFDNNAVLYNSKYSVINIINQESNPDQVFRNFNIYATKESVLKFYVYSSQYSQYQLQVELNSQEDVSNFQCNSNPISLELAMDLQLCTCSNQYIDNTCQVESNVIDTKNRTNISLQGRSEALISFQIPQQIENVNVQFETTDQMRIQVACAHSLLQLPSMKSDFYKSYSISRYGIYKIDKFDLQQCRKAMKDIQDKLSLNYEENYVILVINPNEYRIQAQLQFYIEIENQKNYTFFYILGSLIFLLFILLIAIVIYFVKKRKSEKIQITKILVDLQSKVKQNEFIYKEAVERHRLIKEFSDCAICLETFQDDHIVNLTSCNHVFHNSCLKFWLKKQQTCPQCRGTISLKVMSGNEILAKRQTQLILTIES